MEVVGLTPHCPRTAEDPETSAVWKIVDEWNDASDDDGIPFREKIFAIFPGFEPNVNDGSTGVHLLFLFDPEIGRDQYLSLYDAIMDGRNAWKQGSLQPTRRRAEDIFETIKERSSDSQGGTYPWSYILFAPHIETNHGLLKEIRKDVFERFPCEFLSGYELGNNRLPEDIKKARHKLANILLSFMNKHHQSFFHASDAYSMEEIGRRYTWIKLASPRIEALRQAFLARKSRIRISSRSSEKDSFHWISDDQNTVQNQHPWLKEIEIRGSASFFRSTNGSTKIRFSPDLTCIIGGSMTGKSTLLDGLRVHIGAEMPSDDSIHRQVTERGQNIFRAGSPEIKLDCPGSNPTAPDKERWPARFFAQNELQRLAMEDSAIEDILAMLSPLESSEIKGRTEELMMLDGQLGKLAERIAHLENNLVEATQLHESARRAKDALSAFSSAGLRKLHRAGRDLQRWVNVQEDAEDIRSKFHTISESIADLDIPDHHEAGMTEVFEPDQAEDCDLNLRSRWSRILDQVRAAAQEMSIWTTEVAHITKSLESRRDRVRVDVERALADGGLDANRLREIQALNRQAALLPSYEANLEQVRQRLTDTKELFEKRQAERQTLVVAQRKAFDRVLAEVKREFDGRIRGRRIEDGVTEPLDKFVRALKQKGITRWWNDLSKDNRPSPMELLKSIDGAPGTGESRAAALKDTVLQEDSQLHSVAGLRGDPCPDVGMSDIVQATFRESLTRSKRWELATLRCPDRYVLELEMNDGRYRSLHELSGGQRVSVLLSLLLKSSDNRPLVIDQPEDELDNRFLFETVLPALQKIKGRRQVIVATHNANIIVNGDADMVIQLEASASHGQVASAGAIEVPAIRNAIVQTVDGGEEAFLLRQRKYGF